MRTDLGREREKARYLSDILMTLPDPHAYTDDYDGIGEDIMFGAIVVSVGP